MMTFVSPPLHPPGDQRQQRTTHLAPRHLPTLIYNHHNKVAYPQCLVLLHHVQAQPKGEQIR
jgi:predicted alpha/beta-hydrolase family hydrolase